MTSGLRQAIALGAVRFDPAFILLFTVHCLFAASSVFFPPVLSATVWKCGQGTAVQLSEIGGGRAGRK